MIVNGFVIRFFCLDRGPVVELVNKMRQFRAHCFTEAARLATSLNADSAVFDHDDMLIGFLLNHTPDNKREWEALSFGNANGKVIYKPTKKTLVGKTALKQMKKFSLPRYQDALKGTIFDKGLKMKDGRRACPQLQFHDMTVYIVCPFYPLDGEQAPEGFEHWTPLTQIPEWKEISESEFHMVVENGRKNQENTNATVN